MEVNIGDRIECDGHRGTVLYIGEIPPTKGLWFGVEWDDPARGKHDGSRDGVRYFTTRFPNSGSFIRPNKVSPRISLHKALCERYLLNAVDNYADKLLIEELKDEMNAPFLELVGLEKIGKKQSQLHELKVVVLDHMGIHSCECDIKTICPSIQELNLSSNLFNSWTTISEIVQPLCHLSILNISDNKLNIPENCVELSGSFQSLKHLVMGSMDYDWQDVMKCSSMWRHIENLMLPSNRISSIGIIGEDVFCSLKSLNLDHNSIEHWEVISPLGQLPNLEYLSLYETGLQSIQIKRNSFVKLSKLCISNNRISQWKHISELDKLPMLIDVKITGNVGLTSENYETFIQWVVARIGNLKVLNGSEITSSERRGAELDYLKHYGRDYLAAMESNDGLLSFLMLHPRYGLLVQKYGPPELEELERKPATLKSTLINVKLTSGSKSLEKKLPSTMAVQKLKTLCHRLFHLGSSDVLLYSVSSKEPDIYIPLDNDLRPLSFFSLEDGDTVIVEDHSYQD